MNMLHISTLVLLLITHTKFRDFKKTLCLACTNFSSLLFNSNDIHALTYYACTYFSDNASHS